MTYIHHSPEHFILDRDYTYRDREGLGGKPDGLWYSDPGENVSWAQWCLDNEYAPDRLRYAYELTFRDYARILHLRTPAELLAFSDANLHTGEDPAFGSWRINWQPIYDQYDAIYIAPYQWEHRWGRQTMWYAGWDCASGCVWNLHAIDTFVPTHIPSLTD